MSHGETTAWEKTENAARSTGKFLAPVGAAAWRGVRFIGGKTKDAAVTVYDKATDHEEPKKKTTMTSGYETVDVPMSTAFGSGALSGSGYQQPILSQPKTKKASPKKKKGEHKHKSQPVPTAKAFGEGALSRWT